MPKIYSIDVQVAMTVYVNADSEAEALEIINGLKEAGIELPTGYIGGDLDGEVTNDTINAELPEISFSPAATIKGAYDLDTLEVAYDSDDDPNYEEAEEADAQYGAAVAASDAPDRFDD